VTSCNYTNHLLPLNVGISIIGACTCPGSDHPGPIVSQGCLTPEINTFEAERDKGNLTCQVASQSAQFAPFIHDYVYLNDTTDEWNIFDTSMTVPDTSHGSAVYVPFIVILIVLLNLTLWVSGNK
jgi:hypothetical protein